MLTLYFLLGESKPFSQDTDILINILNRFSMFPTAYEIDYCYWSTPPSRKADRIAGMFKRRNQIVEGWTHPEKVIVAMGWMATELLLDVGKTRAASVRGCRFPVPPFRYDTWFTFDPSAALFDPPIYVDIMATVSAAIRYAGRPIVINTRIKPFEWPI
jgi:hypothetical protein